MNVQKKNFSDSRDWHRGGAPGPGRGGSGHLGGRPRGHQHAGQVEHGAVLTSAYFGTF